MKKQQGSPNWIHLVRKCVTNELVLRASGQSHNQKNTEEGGKKEDSLNEISHEESVRRLQYERHISITECRTNDKYLKQ